MNPVDRGSIRWLTHCPASDGNFRSSLMVASAATCRAALKYRGLTKTARTAIERRLRRVERS